jgi:hypothetical protein
MELYDQATPAEIVAVIVRSLLSSWAMKTALKLQELAPAARQAVDTLVDALPKRR